MFYVNLKKKRKKTPRKYKKYFVYLNFLSYFCQDFPIKLKLMRFGIDIFIRLSLAIVCGFFACDTVNNDNNSLSLQTIDLAKHGIPAVIQIPEDATITEDPQSREKGLVITSPQFNMRVDVYSLDSAETATSWLSDRLDGEKLEGDFSKMIVEDSLGFVLERKDKDMGTSYHFRYLLQKEDALIIFSEGVPQKNNFDLHTIMQMYNAVKQ